MAGGCLVPWSPRPAGPLETPIYGNCAVFGASPRPVLLGTGGGGGSEARPLLQRIQSLYPTMPVMSAPPRDQITKGGRRGPIPLCAAVTADEASVAEAVGRIVRDRSGAHAVQKEQNARESSEKVGIFVDTCPFGTFRPKMNTLSHLAFQFISHTRPRDPLVWTPGTPAGVGIAPGISPYARDVLPTVTNPLLMWPQ